MTNKFYPVKDSMIKSFFEHLRDTFNFKFNKQTSLNELNKVIDSKMKSKKFINKVHKKHPSFSGILRVRDANREEFDAKVNEVVSIFNSQLNLVKKVVQKSKLGTLYQRTHIKWTKPEIEFLKNRSGMDTKLIVKSYYNQFGFLVRTVRSITTKIRRLKQRGK